MLYPPDKNAHDHGLTDVYEYTMNEENQPDLENVAVIQELATDFLVSIGLTPDSLDAYGDRVEENVQTLAMCLVARIPATMRALLRQLEFDPAPWADNIEEDPVSPD